MTENKHVLLVISGLYFAEIGNFAVTECYIQLSTRIAI
jgi:hypothetical protein